MARLVTSDAQAAQSIQSALQSQRQSVSGVNLDDQAVQLMKQQQAYQGAARLINVINTLMQTVIGLVTTVP